MWSSQWRRQRRQRQNIDFILACCATGDGRRFLLLPAGWAALFYSTSGSLAVKFGGCLPQWPAHHLSASHGQKKTTMWTQSPIFPPSSISPRTALIWIASIFTHHDPVARHPQHINERQAVPGVNDGPRRRKMSSETSGRNQFLSPPSKIWPAGLILTMRQDCTTVGVSSLSLFRPAMEKRQQTSVTHALGNKRLWKMDGKINGSGPLVFYCAHTPCTPCTPSTPSTPCTANPRVLSDNQIEGHN